MPSAASVFGSERDADLQFAPPPAELALNTRLEMDGKHLLDSLPEHVTPVAFLDSQHPNVINQEFIPQTARVLIPSGHLFLWIDKFDLLSGYRDWLKGTPLEVVDLVTWYSGETSAGCRTKRSCGHLLVLQKSPRRAKGVWKVHDIPDVWQEPTHKTLGLLTKLISAVSNEQDVVVDPATGRFPVFSACKQSHRNFLGC